MEKIRIGVLGPSDIANRRFIPGVLSGNEFEYAGVAYAAGEEWSDPAPAPDDPVLIREREKAEAFRSRFGGKVYNGYRSLLEDGSISAVYVPLPPGLHARWAREALGRGKHVLLEKPFTVSFADTEEIVKTAAEKKLAIHENFAFIFHRQIAAIDEIVKSGEIGEVRLICASFGFPYRGEGDFRYHKKMGGGALWDCGGYPIRLADHLLGGGSRVTASSLHSARGHDVDVFGSATLEGKNGLTAQISFGMDNSYKCEVEIWGSAGVLSTGRVFTPPADMRTEIMIRTKEERRVFVEPDDQFRNSAAHFHKCITDSEARLENYGTVLGQAKLFREVGCGK